MDYSKEENIKNKQRQTASMPKVKNKVGFIVFRVIVAVVLIGGFAAVGAVVGAYLGILDNAPSLRAPEVIPDIYTTIIYAGSLDNEVDRLKGEENREYVPLNKIPMFLRDAFVAIEDERFYTHSGVDLRGMFRALYVNLSNSGRREGASTITQQLIKNTVMKITRNSFETKLQEQYLAVQYEKVLASPENLGNKKAAKDYILELYLNTIALGHGLNGVQTAAMYYFNKEVNELNLAESAVIAAITQNPVYNAPDDFPESNQDRQQRILEKMLELEKITQQQYDEALADDVYSRVGHIVTEEEVHFHSYYNDRVIADVMRDLQEQHGLTPQEAADRVYNRGLKIITPQDLSMQKIMDDAFMDDRFFPISGYEIEVQYYVSFKNGITGKTENKYKKGTIKSEEEKDAMIQSFRDELLGVNDEVIAERDILIPQPQMAMVIIDYHTGEVKAVTGGRGAKSGNRTLNRATDSPRQPGSVFKVLASYLPAIDLGKITPSTVIDDAPYKYGDKEFKNWYSGYRGPQTVRVGIRDSMNILAVKNMVDTGIDTCFDYLMNLGFNTLVDQETIDGQVYSDRNAATALGGITHGVTQLEVTAAFGSIANGGEYNKPVFYTKVLDHDGKVLLENNVEPRQVIKSTSAYLLTNMMQDVVTAGTGRKIAFKEVNMPISGKTGTTTDTKDLTFVGYTPYYAAGVWLGYDYPKVMHEDNGYHMLLWSHVMEEIHRDLPYKDFEQPAGIVTATVCKLSGYLAASSCTQAGSVYTDIFATSTQPTEYCSGHVSFHLDTSTNMKAGPNCPSESVIYITGMRPDNNDGYVGNYSGEIYTVPSYIYLGAECTYHNFNPNTIYDGTTDPGYYIDSDGNMQLTTPSTSDPDATDTTNQLPANNASTPTAAPVIPTEPPAAPIITPTEAPEQNQSIIITPEVLMPVPEYTSPPPTISEQQSTPAEPIPNNSQSLPVLDQPVSVDGFSY